MKRSRDSGLTVETQCDFGLCATSLRLLAPPGRTENTGSHWPNCGKKPKKHLSSSLISTQNIIGILLPPPQRKFYPMLFFTVAPFGNLWIEKININFIEKK